VSTSSYRDIDRVCQALKLQKVKAKKGHIWKGIIGQRSIRIVIHDKAPGRDVPDGTFAAYIKRLGFKDIGEYREFLKKL